MFEEKIDQLISESLKGGNKTELAVWRALKNEFLTYKTAKAGNVIDNAVEGKIIQKLVSQHKDSIEQFKSAGRDDLVEKEQAELDVLNRIAPKEPNEDEVRESVAEAMKDIIATNGTDYQISMRDMKAVQTYVRSIYPTVNGGVVSKIFVELNKN